MANKDILQITFDAESGLKDLEKQLLSSMDEISGEASQKLTEAFTKAGRDPKVKKQLTGIYQGLFDELAEASGEIDSVNKAIERFVGRIEYVQKVARKKDIKGLFDNLSIGDVDKILKYYDKIAEKEAEINRLSSDDFRSKAKEKTAIKSLQELEKVYGSTAESRKKYEEQLSTYAQNAGVNVSTISKEIEAYSTLVDLFEKVNSTKVSIGSEDSIKKQQALLYVMNQIQELESGSILFSKFRTKELIDVKGLQVPVATLTQQLEASVTSMVNSLTKTLNSEIAQMYKAAGDEAVKLSNHQAKIAAKTQAKVENALGQASGVGAGSGKGEGSGVNEYDYDEHNNIFTKYFDTAKKSAEELEDLFAEIESNLDRLYQKGEEGDLNTKELKNYITLYEQLENLTGKLDGYEIHPDYKDYYKTLIESDGMLEKHAQKLEKIRKEGYLSSGSVSNKTDNVVGIDRSEITELQKEITEVKEDLVSLKGRVDTLEDTTSFDNLSNQVSEFDKKIKGTNDTLLHLKDTIGKLTSGKALGQVITDMSKYGRNHEGSGELLAYSSSSTGYTSDMDISDSATGITKEFRNEVYNRVKAVSEAIDTQIHSHPDNEIAAASYDDIGVMIRQLEEGITKQAVTSLSQVMTFDFSSTGLSEDELKVKLLSIFEEYKKWVFKYFSPVDEKGNLHELAPLTDEMEKNIVEYAKNLLKVFPNMEDFELDSDVTQMLFQDKIKEAFSKQGLGDVVKLSNLVDIEPNFSFSDIRNVADTEFRALTSQVKEAVEKGYAAAQDSHSPSKEFEKLENDAVDGIAKGAKENEDRLKNIGEQMADNVKEGFKEGMSEIGTTTLSPDNQSSVLSGSEQVDEAREEVQAVEKLNEELEINNKSLKEKLQILKDLQKESKFLETAEERRMSMEDKAYDVGGNNPKSEADSQKKIQQYEDLCEHIEKANAALDEFSDKYEKIELHIKNGATINGQVYPTGKTIYANSIDDLEDLKLTLKEIDDIKFLPWAEEDRFGFGWDDEIIDPLQKTEKQAKETSAALSQINQTEVLSSPTQTFDNEVQKDLVYLENYKNTIEEINKLKIEPQTDEVKKKIEELQKLADYFFASMNITKGQWGNDGANFVPSSQITSILNDRGYYSESLSEIYKIGKQISSERGKLDVYNIQSEFSGISEEIQKIESKSEGLRNALTKDLTESTEYVSKLRAAFLNMADTQEELKTESSPKWIEKYNEDIDRWLTKFPELIKFKDKFLSYDSAKKFVDTDEWMKFISTLPQARTYLESIGYEFKEIGQANQTPLSLVEESSGQMALFEGVEEQQKKVVESVKETNQVIEGQIDLFQHLTSLQAKDTFVSIADETAEIKEETKVIEKNTKAVEENNNAKKRLKTPVTNPSQEGFKPQEGWVKSVNKAWTQAIKEDEQRTGKTLLENYTKIFADLSSANGKVSEYQVQLNNLKSVLDEIQKLVPVKLTDDNAIKKLEKLDIQAKELVDDLHQTKYNIADQTEIDRLSGQISNILNKNTAMPKDLKKQFEELREQLHRTGMSSEEVDKISKSFIRLKSQMLATGKVGASMGDKIKKKFSDVAAYFATYVSIQDFIQMLRRSFEIIKEYDDALTEMRKVTDESVKSLKEYQKASFDVANTVGTTATALQKSTADFLRIGESLEQAAASAQTATVLFNVSEFESIDEATDSLVSMSAAFKELSKGEIVDVVNQLGNNFAISTDGLATALQNSASALKTAQNDFFEAAALTTAANTVTQDPDKVGAGLRTIALRLTGTEAAREELAEMGEDVDDFIVTTTSKMDQKIKDLTKTQDKMGVSLLDMNGNYRSTYEVLLDIAKVWDTIAKEDLATGENRQNALLEMMAGKNRANILASILQSPDVLEEAYASALNADGSAQKELDKYLDSVTGKVAKFQNQLQELATTSIDSEAVKGLIDFGTKLLSLLTDLIDKAGVLGTLGGIGGIILGAKNVGKRRSTMFHFYFEYADRDRCLLY